MLSKSQIISVLLLAEVCKLSIRSSHQWIRFHSILANHTVSTLYLLRAGDVHSMPVQCVFPSPEMNVTYWIAEVKGSIQCEGWKLGRVPTVAHVRALASKAA